MNIFYDTQIFSMQRYGGVSNYFAELAGNVLQMGNDIIMPLGFIDNAYLRNNSILKRYLADHHYSRYGTVPLINNWDFPGKKRLFKLLEDKHVIRSNNKLCLDYLSTAQFDIFHPTYYNPYFADHLHGKPFVLTIYDMIHELYTHYFKNTLVSEHKKLLVQKASRIIAISQSTKDDLVRLLAVPPEKVDVIHLASSIKRTEGNYTINLPSKFILFTGLRWGYKNFETFIKACATLLVKYDLDVVCTAQPFTKNEKELFNALSIGKRIHYIKADDSTLSELYSRALLFVFPSMYEGFGIPVLDAFNCGCPVILSNCSSLPEIGGDAAVYVDPHSERDIAAMVEMVVTTESKRTELIQKGYVRGKLFSWQKTAEETITVYKKTV